jgi:hypothetical protein
MVGALALGAAGCGGSTKHASKKQPPKHTVLVHASLAYGAFHRFIWVPARAGDFSQPLSQAIGQGAAAARFASDQLKIAAHHVQHSKQLRVLFAPLQVTADKIKALGALLSEPASLAQIEAINSILGRIAAIAKANDSRIVEASPTRVAEAGGPRV